MANNYNQILYHFNEFKENVPGLEFFVDLVFLIKLINKSFGCCRCLTNYLVL